MRALINTLADKTSSSSSSKPSTQSSSSFSTPPQAIVQKSPWHSPLPYLFGGLAAMLGLIAFALLLLACSYWKLSNHEESGGSSRDVEQVGGDDKSDRAPALRVMPVFKEKIVVIMAGDVKPTFLATPVSSRASSFDDGMKKNDGNFWKTEMEEGIIEKAKNCEVENDEHQTRSSRSQEAAPESHEENLP